MGQREPRHHRKRADWLIGFSKSGYGAQDLILKHPDLFALAATLGLPGRHVVVR